LIDLLKPVITVVIFRQFIIFFNRIGVYIKKSKNKFKRVVFGYTYILVIVHNTRSNINFRSENKFIMEKIKVLAADDHQIVLDGLSSIIKSHPEFDLIASVNNGKQALDIIENIKIDVVLLDIDMPVMNGIETTKLIKSKKLEVKILILSMHHEKNLIKNLIHCGIDGYILKNTDKNELILAIKTVYNGEKYFDNDVKASLANSHNITKNNLSKDDGFCDLTTREMEILRLIAEGNSNKQIGEMIHISHRTVDTHRTNIMKKIDVNNIAGIIRYALQKGIVSS
jgi:two-component system response regulator NreC